MWKRCLSFLSILLGLAGFCALPFIVGVHDLVQTIGQVGWLCIVLFIVNAAGTQIMPAIGWWMILRAEGIPASLFTTLQANLMGYPLNVMTPSMFLGGEPLKTLYLATVYDAPKGQILATIIVAKFQELGGIILGMVAATALFVWHTDYFTMRLEALLIAALALLIGLFGLTLYTFIGPGKPLVTIVTFLARYHLFPRLMARLIALAHEVEERIRTTLVYRRRVLLLAQIITCFSAVSIFIRPWIFFRALPHVTIGFDQLCVFFVLTNLVNTFTIIPGALGLFEATMAGYAIAAGLGDAEGAAFALVSRLADLTLVTLGVWLIFHHGLTRIVRERKRSHTPTAALQGQPTDTSPVGTIDVSGPPG
jgi:uncharacterized protein (TIRG00374 family)